VGSAEAERGGGSRDAILLLHGQPGRASDWDRLIAEIGGAAPTVAIDRPGWDGQTGPADLEGNGLAALAALDRAGIQRGVAVGHSFGGAVAAWLAAHHPERVSSMVLAAPAANVASLVPLDYLLALPLVGDLLSVGVLAGAGAALAAAPLRGRVAGALALDGRYLRSTSRTLLDPGAWRAFVAEQRTLVRQLPLLEQHLGSITAPTTIVIGASDRIVPVASARKLAEQIPGATLRVLEGANHLLPHHRPGALARLALVAAAVG
jgi:pimeloyl-ACP methyl ester carboxylesterase